MELWQEFFLDYLDYLNLPVNLNDDYLTTKWQDGQEIKKATYTFNREKAGGEVIGFYPGTNFYYQILESSIQRGAFVSTYLSRDDNSLRTFVPYLYLYLQVISPAPNSPKPYFSLLVNLYDGTLIPTDLKNLKQTSKGPSLKRNLTYKAAIQRAFYYIADILGQEKEWLYENQTKWQTFLDSLAKANLSKAEEEKRLAEARSRLLPYFQAQIKLLGRLFIN